MAVGVRDRYCWGGCIWRGGGRSVWELHTEDVIERSFEMCEQDKQWGNFVDATLNQRAAKYMLGVMLSLVID